MKISSIPWLRIMITLLVVILSLFSTIKIAGEPYTIIKYEINTFQEITASKSYYLPFVLIILMMGQLTLLISVFFKNLIPARAGLVILTIGFINIFLRSFAEYFSSDIFKALLTTICIAWLYSIIFKRNNLNSHTKV